MISSVLGQNGETTDQSNNWEIYQKSNSGLPDNNAIKIILEPSGEKWIGTKHQTAGYLDYVKDLAQDEIVVCCDNREYDYPF